MSALEGVVDRGVFQATSGKAFEAMASRVWYGCLLLQAPDPAFLIMGH